MVISYRKWRPPKPIDWEETKSGCWECTSHRPSTDGYPQKYENLVPYRQTTHNMARWMYTECFGEPSAGDVVRHKCDNKLCINPEHLEIGTDKDNRYDRLRNNTWGNKLTIEQAREIRNEYVAGNKYHPGNAKELANKYGLTVNSVRRMANGGRWKCLETRAS